MVRRDMMKPGRQDASRYRSRQPRRSSGIISARSGKRSRVARVAPTAPHTLHFALRGAPRPPGSSGMLSTSHIYAVATWNPQKKFRISEGRSCELILPSAVAENSGKGRCRRLASRKFPEPRDEPRRFPFLLDNVCFDEEDGTVRDRLAPRIVPQCFDLVALAQTAACWQTSGGG